MRVNCSDLVQRWACNFLRICRQGDAEAAVAQMTGHLQRIENSLRLDGAVPDRQTDLVKALLS